MVVNPASLNAHYQYAPSIGDPIESPPALAWLRHGISKGMVGALGQAITMGAYRLIPGVRGSGGGWVPWAGHVALDTAVAFGTIGTTAVAMKALPSRAPVLLRGALTENTALGVAQWSVHGGMDAAAAVILNYLWCAFRGEGALLNLVHDAVSGWWVTTGDTPTAGVFIGSADMEDANATFQGLSEAASSNDSKPDVFQVVG